MNCHLMAVGRKEADVIRNGVKCMSDEGELMMARSRTNSGVNWRRQAEQLQREAYVFYFLFKHPRTPWYTKAVAACATAYLFSPVQLIPSFIPVIGFLDDFLVLYVGAKLIKKITPPDLLMECRELADVAEARRREEVRSGIARFARILTAATWLLATIAASALVAAYIYH
jgi:uncharacterized membrane protein YkvA (DUF1232 family)